MHLHEIEAHRPATPLGDAMRAMDAQKLPLPEIWHLLAWKPEVTEPLTRFTQAVMRGTSELSAGERELIAAFASGKNRCLF